MQIFWLDFKASLEQAALYELISCWFDSLEEPGESTREREQAAAMLEHNLTSDLIVCICELAVGYCSTASVSALNAKIKSQN